MVHCPECQSTLEETSDLEFVEMGATMGVLKASKRYYIARCADCGAAIGSGVAGKSGGGGSAA